MTSLLAPVTDFSDLGIIFNPPTDIKGLDPALHDTLSNLVTVWNRKRARNSLRSRYADGKHRLRDIGFSIPPSMRNLEEVVGWPAKAVNAHAERCMFDGFVSPNSSDDSFDLNPILSANRWDIELPMAISSSMIHSCVFMAVSEGDESAGEPPVLTIPHSAQWSSALWNFRTRSLKAALTIDDIDDYARPTRFRLWTPFQVITCQLGREWYVDDVWTHGLGRVPVEVLSYRPTIDRPFGRSIINRAVMSITDDAVRTVLRSEVSAEFYSAPQWLLLGADPDSFKDDDGNPIPVWEFVIGRLNMIGKDEDGDVPKLGQITQQSVQPHIDQMRELACRFAGETNVPVSSLGIIQDNPSSAEAMHAAEKDLVIDCSAANRVYGASLRRIAQDIIMLRDHTTEVTDEMAGITARWRNPSLPSVIDAGDAMVKLVGAFPWLADTTVALEEVGFTDEQITRLLSEKRRAEAKSALNALAGMNGGGNDKPDSEPQGNQSSDQIAEDGGEPRTTGDGPSVATAAGNGTGTAA